MSKVALNRLMDKVLADAAKKINGLDAAKAQRKEFYYDANAITLDEDDLQDQVAAQLEKYYSRKITDDAASTELASIVSDMFDSLVKTIKTKALPLKRVSGQIEIPEKTNKLYYEANSNGSYTVYAFPTIRSKVNKNTGVLENNTSDNYDRIYSALFKNTSTFISPFKQIQDELEKKDGWIERHFRTTKKQLDKKGSSLTMFDIGHAPASNIQMFVSRRVNSAVEEASNQTGVTPQKIREGLKLALSSLPTKIIAEADQSIILDIEAKFIGSTKEFIIGTKPEASSVNRGKKENEYLDNLNKSIFGYIREQSADYWAEHEGSDSAIRAISKELVQTASKLGFEISNKELLKPIDRKGSKVSTKIKLPRTIIRVKNKKLGINIPGKAPISTRPEATASYLNIIEMINRRLPSQVRSNMGIPGLVNRTGTFSESTKVTNITTTPQGFPSIEFEYERSPYGVFDKTTGKTPWNTPARDPSNLVSRSVREIAQEIGMTRFYTRRRG